MCSFLVHPSLIRKIICISYIYALFYKAAWPLKLLELSNGVCREEEELGMYILEWTSSLFKVEHLHWLINSAGHVILL